MSTAEFTFDIAINPVKRRAWVQYALRSRGLSISEIARRENVKRWAVSQALDRPMARLERAIASAVEIPVQLLFPERYDQKGRRLVRTLTIKSTTPRKNRHVEKRGAA